MKFKALIFVLASAPILASGQSNPFQGLQRDSIVAYEYNGEAGYNIEDCIISYPEKIKRSSIVSPSEIANFEMELTAKDAYGNITAACFDPHLGIVSWKNGEIVAAVSICISCNFLESSLEIESTSINRVKISDNDSYAAKGFSPATRKVIYAFCQNLGFTKYIGTLESIFDE